MHRIVRVKTRENLISRSAFTLIELLVVIAIIAILAVVVVLTLNPAELLRQSRDANRVSDMSTLNSALNLYSTDQSGSASFSMGSSSVVYISLPDPSATSTTGSNCASMDLPTLPSAYSYHCAASSTYRNINGSGWIPVNLSLISSGSPLGSLPIDPTNNSSSRLYYTYDTNGTQFEVTTPMESQKYQTGGSNDVISGDGGPLASVYEKGSLLGLEPLDYGDTSLVGWWPLDEGTGTNMYDHSGGGRNQYVNYGGPTWVAGKVENYALKFGGNDSIRYTASAFPSYTAITMMAWVNSASSTQNRNVAEFGNGSYTGTNFSENSSGGISTNLYNGVSSCGALSSPSGIVTNGQWQLVGFTYDGTTETIYNNGVAVASSSVSCGLFTNTSFYTGWASTCGTNCGITATIDDERIYDRALSAGQIAAMYNEGK